MVTTPMPLPDSRTEPDGSAVIRVLSYNVRSMKDDTEALARVVRACAPDLVCVQEAPRFFRWRKAAARLAAMTDLVMLSGGATAAGPLLLCSLRATVERTEDVLLPLTPGLHRRGLATAVVRIAGARLGVVSCHLSLQREERRSQAGLLLDRIDAMGVPHAVVAGDLNDVPEGAPSGSWRGGSRTAASYGPGAESSPSRPAHRASGSTRCSRPAASRCSAAASPRTCPA